MRTLTKVLLLLLPALANAQQHLPDSTIKALKNATNDSMRYKANTEASYYFEEINRDSALYYAGRSLLLAQKNNKKLAIAQTLSIDGYQLTGKGRYAEALERLLRAFEIAENGKNASSSWLLHPQSTPERSRLLILSNIHHMFAVLMSNTQNVEQQIYHFKEAKRIAQQIDFKTRIMLADMNLGRAYLDINKIDSASMFENEAEALAINTRQKKYLGIILCNLGDIAIKKGDKEKGKQFYNEGVRVAIEQNNRAGLTRNYLKLTDYYLAQKEKDSSVYYAIKTLETFKTLGQTTSLVMNLGIAYQNLYNSYKLKTQLDSAFKYAGLALVAKDSLYHERITNLAQFQNISFREQLRLQRLEKEKVLYQSKVRTYALLAGLGVFLVVALILYRNNRQKHKANKKLESTLSHLNSTQTQLIQSEKMASLGELTAGIAHEIQNPLNFVNNFAEVSIEMLEEMKIELKSNNIKEAIDIVDDIEQNLEKINYHGKRADGIVKGMLQHSRASSNTKEPTDINTLADEYLRLAYHGLRAKDKSFNAEIVTLFDKKLPVVNVVPQDIGRVLLNLFTNAFYAVQQKQKTAGDEYKPIITVSTSVDKGMINIKVGDNGNGIADNIKDKIMQPFFTTKPTGEGTGLGLSLSYDIVVKGHGGNLNVLSKDGEYTEFSISIPL